MNLRKHRILAILIILLSPLSLLSQFTYIDVNIGNKVMNIYKAEGLATTYKQTNIHVNGVWRFRRHFGVGITASLPISQRGKYGVLGLNGQRLTKYDVEYIPSLSFDYYFRESARIAFNGRFYAGIRSNFYIDGRVSMFSFTEHLKASNYTTSITEENKLKQIAPGFSIGFQPHIRENLVFNINMGLDFYNFKDAGFKTTSNGEHSLPLYAADSDFKFRTQLPEKKAAFSFNIGLGYKF